MYPILILIGTGTTLPTCMFLKNGSNTGHGYKKPPKLDYLMSTYHDEKQKLLTAAKEC